MKITSVHAFSYSSTQVHLESDGCRTEIKLTEEEGSEILSLVYQIIMRRKAEILAPLSVIEAPLLTGPAPTAEFDEVPF